MGILATSKSCELESKLLQGAYIGEMYMRLDLRLLGADTRSFNVWVRYSKELSR